MKISAIVVHFRRDSPPFILLRRQQTPAQAPDFALSDTTPPTAQERCGDEDALQQKQKGARPDCHFVFDPEGCRAELNDGVRRKRAVTELQRSSWRSPP